MVTLKHFTIRAEDGAYLLSIETEDGQTTEVAATFEQLDLISEEIDRVLDEDEEEALSGD
jgi:hypothetical protein